MASDLLLRLTYRAGVAEPHRSLKEKAKHELVEYAINVVYLALVFAAFTVYKRLVLTTYHIVYTDYWVAVIEAIILGKVIMIGGIMRLGRRLEDKPLIYATLYKSIVFGLFCALFKVVEHTIAGLWHGHGIAHGMATIVAKGYPELFGNLLVVFVALVPFFGFKELGRVFGEGRVREIFLVRRSDLSEPSSPPQELQNAQD